MQLVVTSNHFCTKLLPREGIRIYDANGGVGNTVETPKLTVNQNFHTKKPIIYVWCDRESLILNDLEWEIVPHMPYSPGLTTPADYHHFHTMHNLMTGVTCLRK